METELLFSYERSPAPACGISSGYSLPWQGMALVCTSLIEAAHTLLWLWEGAHSGGTSWQCFLANNTEATITTRDLATIEDAEDMSSALFQWLWRFEWPEVQPAFCNFIQSTNGGFFFHANVLINIVFGQREIPQPRVTLLALSGWQFPQFSAHVNHIFNCKIWP